MAVIIPNEGEVQALKNDVAAGGVQPTNLALFKSNTTPTAATVWADLTIANFSGYMTGTPTWGTVATDGSGKASVASSTVTFTHNGGGTSNDVYGWVLYYSIPLGATIIRAIERFSDAPVSFASNGDSRSVKVTLKDFQ